VRMVIATRPGTTVPLRIMRDRAERTVSVTVDELDLEAETVTATGRGGGRSPEAEPEPEKTSGFGMALENVTPDLARRLRLGDARGAVISDVEEESPAQRAGLQPGDVILRVGSTPIANRADAQRTLAAIRSGDTAFLRVFRGGQETFVTVKKD